MDVWVIVALVFAVAVSLVMDAMHTRKLAKDRDYWRCKFQEADRDRTEFAGKLAGYDRVITVVEQVLRDSVNPVDVPADKLPPEWPNVPGSVLGDPDTWSGYSRDAGEPVETSRNDT